MTRHIIQLIWNQRRQNAWLWAELLLVSVFLWFIVDYLYVLGVTYVSPMGFDIDHTYRVTIDELSPNSPDYLPAEKSGRTDGEDLLTVMDRIRSYPGVEAVSLSDMGMPYTPGDRSWTLCVDTVTKNSAYTLVTPDFFQVFRLRDREGNTSTLVEKFREERTFLVSAGLEEEFGMGPLLGRKAAPEAKSEVQWTIRGVFQPIRRHAYTRSEPFYYRLLHPGNLVNGNYDGQLNQLEVCVRVRPDADTDFPARFRKEMAGQVRLGNLYLLDVQSVSYYRDAYLNLIGIKNELKTRVAVACFLLANIFLGIIGTFWFRTEYRKGEMGLRMALGSTRGGLSFIMILEGAFLLAFAFIPAMAIGLNMAFSDLVDKWLLPFDWVRFVVCQSITFALILGMIVCGIWYPARCTTHLEPAEALRYE